MNTRAIAAACLTLFAVACSSSSDPSDTSPDQDAAPPPEPPTPPTPTPPAPPAPPASDAGHDSAPAASGSPFAIVDQIFYGSGGAYQFKLTDYAMGCSLQQQSNTNKQNSQYWKMVITTPSNGVIPVGTYALNVPSNGVTVAALGVHKRDATCTEINNDATSGSVTITSASASSIKGTIDVVLPIGGAVSVPFSASFCDTTVSTGAKACIP